MIKHITNCNEYFGYGNISDTIHAAICERELGASLEAHDCELKEFVDALIEKYAGCSFYLFVKTDIVSSVKRRRGLWAYLGEEYKRGVMAEQIWSSGGDTVCGVGEFSIEHLKNVITALAQYPFSSMGVISENGRAARIAELMRQNGTDEAAKTINHGCTAEKAVIAFIAGCDGESLCCFSKMQNKGEHYGKNP